jgi:hypothetical protein
MEHHVQCDGCHCYAIDNTAALKPAESRHCWGFRCQLAHRARVGQDDRYALTGPFGPLRMQERSGWRGHAMTWGCPSVRR